MSLFDEHNTLEYKQVINIRTFAVDFFVGSFAAVGRVQMLATILALVALLVPRLHPHQKETSKETKKRIDISLLLVEQT
jgi:hypothetical protein